MTTGNITGARITRVAADGLQTKSSSAHIVESTALENLLFDRNATGLAYRRLCRDATLGMLSCIVGDLRHGDLTELVVLGKGLAYQVGAASEELAGVSLPTNLIATQRTSINGSAIGIDVSYQRLEAGGTHLIVGDTIASGSTLVGALAAYTAVHDLEHVYVLSFAGSLSGGRALIEYAERSGFGVTLLYGLAAFGIASNGFDLAFADPETVTKASYRDRANRQFDGRPVSAVGWDFGSQFMSPAKYAELCWREAVYWDLVGHPSLSRGVPPDGTSLLSPNELATLPTR